jgi:hypothetical protein
LVNFKFFSSSFFLALAKPNVPEYALAVLMPNYWYVLVQCQYQIYSNFSLGAIVSFISKTIHCSLMDGMQISYYPKHPNNKRKTASLLIIPNSYYFELPFFMSFQFLTRIGNE